MLEDEKFGQRDVYANNVRIYRQFGRIYEASSDIPKLGERVKISKGCKINDYKM